MKQLLILFEDYELKVVLLEDGEIVEIFIERDNTKDIIGNIYKGKIENIVSGMESIFVEMGEVKKGFLHIKDNNLKKRLCENNEILVQVDTNPRDEKGAKLTLDYSISGKYLVVLPNSKKVSISKKIKNEDERKRLKEIFEGTVETGLIIRTSAVNIDSGLLRKEYDSLFFKWQNIKRNFEKASFGDILYSDNDLIKKTMREFLTTDVDEIIVNNEEIFNKIKGYILENEDLNLLERIHEYTKDENINSYYGINTVIENTLKSKVWLDCGGHLKIEKTEALISIDVNSGANIGTDNFEETILKTNLEATVEIAKQLRLRNLSGIIIIDFIDMKNSKNRKKVLEKLEENLKKDRIATNIVHFSGLGLVEMTRKRQGKELESFYIEKCPFCKGTGSIISEERAILNILSEVKELAFEKDIDILEIVSEEGIIKRIKKEFFEYLELFLTKENKKLKLKLDNQFSVGRFKINLYK